MNKEDLKQIKTIVEKAVDSKIEKLAQITARSFKNTQNQINSVKDKVDELKVEMSEFKDKVDKLENRTERIEDKVDKLENRTERIEDKVDKGVDKMRTIADGMAKDFSHWYEENAFSAVIESRQDQELENHEKRIVVLEKSLK